MSGVAYRCDAAKVVAEWDDYQASVEDVRACRDAFSAKHGRQLMVNRSGFGHGTRVVGLQELDSDKGGDIFGDNGEWRVPKVGPPYRTVTPNLRRKAGKDVAAEMARLNEEGPNFTGMPPFALTGMHVIAPALFRHDGAIYAHWPDSPTNGTGGEFDADLWVEIPLSAYYAAKETYETARAASCLT